MNAFDKAGYSMTYHRLNGHISLQLFPYLMLCPRRGSLARMRYFVRHYIEMFWPMNLQLWRLNSDHKLVEPYLRAEKY